MAPVIKLICFYLAWVMSKDGRHNYDRDTSSDTEDYQDTEDHRRRVFKTRLRYTFQTYYYLMLLFIV